MSNKNAITYKEVFPLLKENKIWIGYTSLNGGRWMILPNDIEINRKDLIKIDSDGSRIMNIAGVCWMTNIEHGKRHEWLKLDTMAHNLKFNKKLRKKFEKDFGAIAYPHYDNYDALEVPFTECIPSDYDGIMGVPITFMDKYNPEQFEILGRADANIKDDAPDCYINGYSDKGGAPLIHGKFIYKRILIRRREDNYENDITYRMDSR